MTWRRIEDGERQKMGFVTWSEAVTDARNKAGWRRQVKGPILLEETWQISQSKSCASSVSRLTKL